MSRVRRITSPLEAGRRDVENGHSSLDDGGERRIEQSKDMNGHLGDQKESAQDAENQVEMCQAVTVSRALSGALLKVGKPTIDSIPWAHCRACNWRRHRHARLENC